MKRLISILLALLTLILPIFSLAEAEEAMEIIMSSGLGDLALTHPYASEYFSSSTQFEVYSIGDEDPVLRLRINYWTEAGFMNIDRVTFTLGEESFTFEGLANPELSIYARPSYCETIIITFDESSADFISALLAACEGLEEGAELPVRMMLHGAVDEEAAPGPAFAQDFLQMHQLLKEMTPAVPNADGVWIVVDAANATVKDRAAIRLSPEISAAVLTYASTGDTFRVRYEEGDWYCIDVGGLHGFIHKGVANMVE